MSKTNTTDAATKKYSVIAWTKDGDGMYTLHFDTRHAANVCQRAMVTGPGECQSATIYDRAGKPLSDRQRRKAGG